MKDKLVVTGLPPLDGEYPFDLVRMVSIGEPGSLTNREGHRVKVMSGVRVGELVEALQAGDNDVLVALAAIVLTRAGKRVDEERLWDAPMGSGVSFVLGDREDDEQDPQVPAVTETDSPSTNGGGSGNPVSELRPVSSPSSTGPPDSERSVISDQQTSVS